MDSFDPGSYKSLFIKNAVSYLDRLETLLKAGEKDLIEIRRLFHNVKGQSLFMGYQSIGDLCLKGEKIAADRLKNNSLLQVNENTELLKIVELALSELKKI